MSQHTGRESVRAWSPSLSGLPVIAVVASVVIVAGCQPDKPGLGPVSAATNGGASPLPEVLWFDDVTARTKLTFKQNPGATGAYHMPESIGSGGAWLDFDQDGRLDIYLLHGAPAEAGVRHQLFHQEADGTFKDVSAGSGLDVTGPGMGVAVGDVNNDGRPDVLLTEVGRARLFLNQGGGRFADVTGSAGIDNSRWGTSAAFLDYDRDGWLDVVIANYVDYSPTTRCYDSKGQVEFCGPQGMAGTATRLFRNRGQAAPGQFEDTTVPSGLVKKIGPALGVLCADFDGDRWVDILVADDGMANRLYVNRRDGTFGEEAVQRGLAFNAFGTAVANMGIAYGDVDGNGLSDLFIPHVSWEQPALWFQGPAGLFLDETVNAGLANLRLRGTGFGAVLADFDHDGDVDLAVANGRIRRGEPMPPFLAGMDPFWEPYAQPNQLMINDGTGRFREVLCPVFGRASAVGRGLASADFDNDGGVDLLVMNTGAPARLWRNVATAGGHWLTVRAVEPVLGGRDAYGAEVTVVAGARRWRQLIQPGSSYLVSNDPRAHFGLGSATVYDRIEVVWPDGTEERFPGGEGNRSLTLRHGTGVSP